MKTTLPPSTLFAALALSLVIGGVRPAAAQTEARTEARERIAQGEALFARDNYEAALAEFERVYELLAGNPRRHVVLFNIAQCHERLFRYDAAMEAYRRYLDEGGAAIEDRAQVEATVRALDGLLGTVELTVSVPAAEVWVDAHRVGPVRSTLRIPAGRHVVSIRARGYLPTQQEVLLSARSRASLRFVLDPVPPPRRRLSPTYFGLAAGLAVVGGGIATYLGVQALGQRDDIDTRLADPVQRFGVSEDDRAALQRTMLGTDIALGSALLFGVTAGVLAFLTEWSAARPTSAVALGLSPGGLSVGGRF